MRFVRLALGLAAIIVLLAGGVYALDRADRQHEVRARLSLYDVLNTSESSFRNVTAARNFSFPDDHGPHPEYALEWWYFTGNLDTREGRHFGYQLTFFRVGLTADNSVPRTSDWATRSIYMAHFALSDVENEVFHAFERHSRDALGLAGAVPTPFRAWLEDWSAEAGGPDFLPLRLKAGEADVEIDLLLNSEKDIVLHGENGLSRKGNRPGEASYYYSLTRMPTAGTVTLNGLSYTVNGFSWLDREWSSAQLSEEHIGWDWFAIQLSDGRDIMYGVLRPRDVRGSVFELGTVVESDGSYRNMEAGDVRLDVLDRWQSPGGGSYPARWRFQMPSEGLDLEITPYASNQELETIVRYWEGAVRIQGTSMGQPISGHGYVELTGYAD